MFCYIQDQVDLSDQITYYKQLGQMRVKLTLESKLNYIHLYTLKITKQDQ